MHTHGPEKRGPLRGPIQTLIDAFFTELSTRLGERPTGFNGGAAGKGFKKLLDAGLAPAAIQFRFGAWFASTDRHIVNRGHRVEDFFTYFNRLKDGPIKGFSKEDAEKERLVNVDIPDAAATRKMLRELKAV